MKKLTVIMGIIFSALFLWFAIKDANFVQVRNAFANANLLAAVPLLGALASFYWLKAVRWSDLLSPTKTIRAHDLIPSMMTGAAGNNLLPVHLGEFIRMYLLAREHNVANSSVFATLVVERLLDIVSVLILLLVAIGFADVTRELQIAGIFLAVLASGVLGVALAFLLYTSACVRFLNRLLRFLPRNIQDKIGLQVHHIAKGLASLRATHLYGRIILNSIVQWLLMAGCIHFALYAFELAVPTYTSIVILGLIVAGLSLPTSPGFVGTIEFCFVLGLQAFDVDASRALGAAIFYHTVLWVTVTLSGLFFMRQYHMTWRQFKNIGKTRPQTDVSDNY